MACISYKVTRYTKSQTFSSISRVINQEEIVEDYPRVREMNRLYFPILIDLAPPITLSGMIILFFNFIVIAGVSSRQVISSLSNHWTVIYTMPKALKFIT